MDDNDDALDVDLTAWQPPSPPRGLADAVIARARQPARVGPVDAPIPPLPARSRRTWLVGGALVAAVATGAVAFGALRGGDNPAALASGYIATAKPSHVELSDSSSVDLEANTDVWWSRDGHRITVTQQRGTATWRVGAEDQLSIDAGATVASVAASGASLRVEVQMNVSAVGTSALTAAAVAMVTVVVYEGQVKVGSNAGETQVAQGNTVEVRPGEAPGEPLAVGIAKLDAQRKALLAEIDRGNADRAKLEAELAQKDAQLDALRTKVETLTGKPIDPLAPPVHAAVAPVKVPAPLRPDFEQVLAGVALDACPGITGATTVTVIVLPTNDVDVSVTGSRSDAGERCIVAAVKAAHWPATQTSVQVTRQLGAACDFDGYVKKGEASFGAGQFATATVAFEAALACKHDPRVVGLAFASACNVGNASKARTFYARLEPARQPTLLQLCIRNNIDPRATAIPDRLDRAAIQSAMASVSDRVLACANGFTGDLTVTVHAAPDGSVTRVAIAPATVAFASCVTGVVTGVKFPPTRLGTDFSYPYVVKPPAAIAGCDPANVQAQETRGTELVSMGNHAAALAVFEKILACDPRIAAKAFVAACNSRQATKAKRLYLQLPPTLANSAAQVCLRNGIDPRPATPTPTNATGRTACQPPNNVDPFDSRPVCSSNTGTVRINSKPITQVYVDGNAGTSQSVPTQFTLPAGKHKLTFVLGGDKLTYPVTVKAGETTTVIKDFSVP